VPQRTLDFPPFPPLKWEHYSWAGEVVLPSWAGFQAGREAKRAAKRPRPSGGIARLSVSPLDTKARTHPTGEQVAAFRHLMDNEADIAAAVARALADYCPGKHTTVTTRNCSR
jgi:hypothetical protein